MLFLLHQIKIGMVRNLQVRAHSFTLFVLIYLIWPPIYATDYQWETTRPVKGEKLEDERFTGNFLRAVMQLAKEVSYAASL